MLSRSKSNAGERLRRAKSTSSAHTSSSGQRQTHGSSDPFFTRQQAEVAALEAFHRALPQQEVAYQDYKPAPSKLQRRRSRLSGKTEGSHFEEARLRWQKSASKKDDNAKMKSAANSSHQSKITAEGNDEEVVVTWRRSVIPPNPQIRITQHDKSVPAPSHGIRKSQTGYTDGSPAPRHTGALKERRSTLQLCTPSTTHSSRVDSNLGQRPISHASENEPNQAMKTLGEPLRNTHSDNEALALARDSCLQDFQQKKLRERKSFILGPFQKRRAADAQKGSLNQGYDTSLPPFNYADESLLPPPPPPAPELTVSTINIVEPKQRNFSEGLKGRFRKVFRRASRVPSEMPAQHVEGKRFSFSTEMPISTPTFNLQKDEDPFTVAGDPLYLVVPDAKPDSACSRHSVGIQSTAKSRMTSWTNSTVCRYLEYAT